MFMFAFGHGFVGFFHPDFCPSISGESILAQQLSCICDGTAAGGASHLTTDVLDSFLAMGCHGVEDGGGLAWQHSKRSTGFFSGNIWEKSRKISQK